MQILGRAGTIKVQVDRAARASAPHIKEELAIPYKSPNETNPWRNRGDGKRRGTRQILIIVKAAALIKREGGPFRPRARLAPVTCAHREPH